MYAHFAEEICSKFFYVGFHLRSDNSGGLGQFQGGEGVVRMIRFREPITLSLLTERRVLEPRGIKGGQNGKCGENILVKKDNSLLYLGPKTSVEVDAGDMLVLKTPGGGGYGVPGSESGTQNEEKMEKSSGLLVAKGSVNQYRLVQESA